MTDADLRKRASNLDELLERLEAPPVDKDRRTIKKPQPLVVEPGDVFRYRVDSQGNVYNPYFTRADQARFSPVAWGSCMVISSGHAFDFLAWFQIALSLQLRCPAPSLEQALRDIDAGVNNVGTLSSAHLKRMNLELIGRVDPPVVAPLTSERIIDVVASDISVSNILSHWLPSGSIGQ
jgi:hypothetical protein